MTLLTKNLNTLPILRALLEEVSVAKAADRVGLSQPTVSGILATLRHQFDDPLLVRSGRGMRLTPRAERLLPMVVDVCNEMDLLFEPEVFDPAAVDRIFAVAAPDHLTLLLTPALMEHLEREAPRARLRFVDVPSDLDAYLHEGRLDLAVCANFGLWPTLSFQRLFDERVVAAMWTEHALASNARLTADELRAHRSISVGSGTATDARRDRVRTGVPAFDLDSTVVVGQFVDAVLLTVGTDLIACAPRALVDRLARSLPVVGVPIEDSHAFPSGTFWAANREHDQEHVWFRSLVERASASLRSEHPDDPERP